MNLKESYRYANYLDNLLDNAYTYIRNKDFVTTTTQTHLREKANPDAHDEVLYVQKPYDVAFTPNDIIDLIVNIIKEKEDLAEAIATAKSSADINIDNAIAMNKKKQEFVSVLKMLSGIKPSEIKTTGYDYKFNAEGNQTKYCYQILETSVIDYNRNDVKALIKKYTKDCDNVSSELDRIEINTVLDFTPKYDINEDLEDIIGDLAED